MANTTRIGRVARTAGLPLLLRTAHGRITVDTRQDEDYGQMFVVRDGDAESEYFLYDKALEAAFRLLARKLPAAPKVDPFEYD